VERPGRLPFSREQPGGLEAFLPGQRRDLATVGDRLPLEEKTPVDRATDVVSTAAADRFSRMAVWRCARIFLPRGRAAAAALDR
jgi:hypothetical protein